MGNIIAEVFGGFHVKGLTSHDAITQIRLREMESVIFEEVPFVDTPTGLRSAPKITRPALE